MKNVRLPFLLSLFVSVIFSSCGYIEKYKEERMKRRDALVCIDDHYLYPHDIDKIIPYGVTSEDSALIAENYIRRWATDIIMYDNAQRNTADKSKIEQMVEDYRRAITIYYYQQRMVQEKVAVPTDNEALAFFSSDSTLFLLDEAAMKGIWVTMPSGNENISFLKKQMLKTDDNLEKIETFALQYAIDYEIFINNWQQTGALQKRVGKKMNINKTGYSEFSDSTTITCVYITDVRQAGSVMPEEIALEVARKKLYNNNKIEYLKNLDNEIYEYALRHNRIKSNMQDK